MQKCRLLWGIVVMLCLAVPAYAQKVELSTWNDHRVVVDGNNSDWQLPYTYSNTENRVQYAVANDRHMLYLTLKTSNDATIYKIQKRGLYIYIDTEGKKDVSTALLCTIKKESGAEEENAELPENSMPMPGDTAHVHRAVKIADNNRIALVRTKAVGFRKCNGTYTPQVQCACPLQVAVRMNDYNEMVWEIGVPWEMLGKDSLLATDYDHKISIGMAMDALPEGDRPPTAVTRLPTRTVTAPTNLDPAHSHNGQQGTTVTSEESSEAMAMPMEDFTPATDWSKLDDITRLTKIVFIWRKVRIDYR